MKKTLCLLMLCGLITHVSADAVAVLVLDNNRTKTAWCPTEDACHALQTNQSILAPYQQHVKETQRVTKAYLISIATMSAGVIIALLAIKLIRRPQRWNNA